MAAKGKTNRSSFPAWDATKIWTNLNWSNFDVASLIKAQQKNVEAINMVNKVAVEGWQAITKKQTAIWQSALEQNRIMVQGVAAAHEPSDKLAMQAAFAHLASKRASPMCAMLMNLPQKPLTRQWT